MNSFPIIYCAIEVCKNLIYNFQKRGMFYDKRNCKRSGKKNKITGFDVEGVLTDGSITYDENGIEYKTFNAKTATELSE